MRPRREIVLRQGVLAERYWRDLWEYRELFYLFAWRDIAARYKQTVLGVLWALIQPLTTLVVFSIIFGRIAGLPSDGIPYPILVYTALLPWQFFATALTNCSNSMVTNANLVRKVYFPRLLVPAGSVMVALVDFAISFSVLALLMAWYGVIPGWQILFLPLFLLVAMAAAFSVGLWFATLNVQYRDFRYIVPFTVQLGVYISPVGFSSSLVPEHWRLLYSINPMVGVIDGFRWALLGQSGSIHWGGFAVSITVIALLMLGGLRLFRRLENSFADAI
jgi:lipopolysaccharide transport system permease protein